ncbi:Ig-like domain repeat protein [Terriglobus sp. RCC_193]|uniref:Ig-like domain repeat protein n=1 Tax=Terriglobus sp. RCC_193 TaxID=3239218 RepID=UPI0035261C37
MCIFLLLLSAVFAVSEAVAQSVALVPNAVRYAGIGTNNRGFNSDSGPATTVALNMPSGMAFDASGNLILADSSNNCVRRVDTTSLHMVTTIAGLAGSSGSDTCNASSNAAPSYTQGLLSPASVSVDAVGNIFIADTGHNCVRELRAGQTGISQLTTVAGTCGSNNGTASATPSPVSLAMDSNSNLYILLRDTTFGVYQVLRYAAGSANGSVCRVAGAASSQNVSQCSDVSAAPALSRAAGIAVDPANQLYIADTGNNCVRKLNNGTFTSAFGTCGSSSSAVMGPSALAFSQSGAMYVALTDNNQVVRYNQNTGETLLVAGNPNTQPGAYAATQDGAAASSLPLNGPVALAEDSNNNLYVADAGNSIVRALRNGTLFPTTNVGQTSSQQTLTFQINTASSLTVVPGTDYAVASGSDTCTGVQTPASAGGRPTYCSVGIVFTPTAAGKRYAPVTITDLTTSTAVNAGLQGVGVGVMAELFPGQAGTLLVNSGTFQDVIHDSLGNLFVLFKPTAGQWEITREPLGAGSPATVVPMGAGLQSPVAMGVDAVGNLYVADSSGSTASTPSIQRYGVDGSVNRDYITGIVAPKALRVDGFGNMLVAEQGTANDIVRIYAGGERQVLAGGGTQTPAEGLAATGVQLTSPSGVAMGPSGTVYFSDVGTHLVYSVDASGILHVIAGGGSSFSSVTGALSLPLSSPAGLDVDAAGDLFIADTGTNSVYTLFFGATSTQNAARLFGTGNGSAGYSGDGSVSSSAALNAPVAVTAAPDGRVFVADTGNGRVRLVTFPGGSVNYGTVAVGSGRTQSQILWNNGNAQLISTGSPVISNPKFVYDATRSTCGSVLLQGAVCDIAITFEPTATGTQSGTATIVNNAATSPQTIQLNGNVVPAAITAFTAAAETENYGGPYVGTVTIATNGGTAPQGTVTFTINGTVTCSVTGSFNGSATCTLPSGTLLPVRATPYPVSVTFTGNYPNQNATTTLTETPRVLTAVVNSKSKVYLQPNPVLDGTPSGLLNGVGSDSFTVTYGFGSTPITTMTTPGTYTGVIVATTTPNGTTNPANYTINITPGSFTITKAVLSGFGADPQTEAYGGAYTATATYAPGAGAVPAGVVMFRTGSKTLCTATFTTTTASCMVAAGTNLQAGSYPITVSYEGDANYNAATASATLTVTPVPLTVSVANQTKVYGAAVPNLTGSATVSGLVNGDAVGSTIVLTYSTTVTASTPIGTYPNSITAAVSGSSAASYTITNTPGSFTVGGVATTTTLTPATSSAAAGVPVTFTAKVASATVIPTGTVVFTADGVLLGTVTLDASGSASLTTAALAAGSHAIRAAYSGNASFASSFATATATTTVPVGSFTLTSTPDAQYIRGPGNKTFTVTLTSQGGFAGTVALTCSGLPVDATCALNPVSVALTAGSTSTITVTTTTTAADTSVAANHRSTSAGNWPGALVISAAAAFPMQLTGLGMMVAGIGRRRKFGRKHWLLLLLLSVGLPGMMGCGASNATYHIYPVTVTGTSVGGGPAPASTTVYLAVGTP